jgi:hypothetical protein
VVGVVVVGVGVVVVVVAGVVTVDGVLAGAVVFGNVTGCAFWTIVKWRQGVLPPVPLAMT